MSITYKTIDEYIDRCPTERQEILRKIRKVIKGNCPDAKEKISWGMPTFYQKENLIHFCLHKKHIGIYPGEEAIKYFRNKLIDYKISKGTIQLSFDKSIPYELIKEIVIYRVNNNS